MDVWLGENLVLGLQDGDDVRQKSLRAHNSLGVVRKHDSNLNTQNSLSHHDVSDSGLNVLIVGEASLDHVSLRELLRLSTLASDLARDRHLGSLGTRFHDESENTVACATHGKSSEKLVLKGLGLGLGVEASVRDTLSEDLDSSFGEVESLLHNRGELSDSLALLSQHVLGAGSLNDDLSSNGGDTHLKTSIAVLGELLAKQL